MKSRGNKKKHLGDINEIVGKLIICTCKLVFNNQSQNVVVECMINYVFCK